MKKSSFKYQPSPLADTVRDNDDNADDDEDDDCALVSKSNCPMAIILTINDPARFHFGAMNSTLSLSLSRDLLL